MNRCTVLVLWLTACGLISCSKSKETKGPPVTPAASNSAASAANAITPEKLAAPAEPYKPKDLTKSNLFPARVKGIYGFIDKTGKMVLEPQFQRALEFSEGLAPVQVKSGLWGYVDASGKMAIKPLFAKALPFSEGLGSVEMGDRWGCINKEGDIVIPAKFSGIGQFNDGVAETLFEQFVQNMKVRGWGYIKANGIFQVPPKFAAVGPFGEGLAPVRIFVKKWGYIDKEQKIKIQPIYESAYQFSDGLAAVESEYGSGYKWGFINHDGKYVIQPRFTLARTFSEGLVGVQIDNAKWGYANKVGAVVIKPVYQDLGQFHNGIALVRFADKERYIDTTGKTVWQEK